jgi:Mlc titration factor MtfA (ptsG expression regulator)
VTALWILPIGMTLVLAWKAGAWALRGRRRRRLMAVPFPAAWERMLQATVPLYRRLPAPLKRQLQGRINVFLAEKRFEGCDGLALTDEMRVTIAALACVLLLNRDTDYYARLVSILVYPHPYSAEAGYRFGQQYVVGEQARSGESWPTGAVVLAWDNIRQEALDIHPPHNLVLHEFAHQLDQEESGAEGLPVLKGRAQYVAWARILGEEYERLRSGVERDQPDILDEYGATNPAEFFAVATETFFDSPLDMKRSHPALYAELRDYYKLDPAEWIS